MARSCQSSDPQRGFPATGQDSAWPPGARCPASEHGQLSVLSTAAPATLPGAGPLTAVCPQAPSRHCLRVVGHRPPTARLPLQDPSGLCTGHILVWRWPQSQVTMGAVGRASRGVFSGHLRDGDSSFNVARKGFSVSGVQSTLSRGQSGRPGPRAASLHHGSNPRPGGPFRQDRCWPSYCSHGGDSVVGGRTCCSATLVALGPFPWLHREPAGTHALPCFRQGP